MRALLIEDAQRSDWDNFVQTTPLAVSWHRYDWSEVLRKYYRLKFYPLVALDGSKVTGILPLYQVRTLRTSQALFSIPYVVAGGIVAENEAAQQALLNKAIELAEQTRSTHIVLRQYKAKIEGNLKTDDGHYNRELTLSENLDDVWKSISETNRAKIAETRKYELVLEYPSGDLDRFYQVLLKNQRDLGLPCVSKRWVAHLLATGMYRIALLKRNSTIVAGTLAKRFKDTVSFPLSCLPDQSERSTLFAYNLYSQLLTRFAQDGVRIFHSGRIPRKDAAPAYRLGWGGAKCYYYYQYYESSFGHYARYSEASKEESALANVTGWKRRLFESVWKRIPLRVAAILGPTIVAQFP